MGIYQVQHIYHSTSGLPEDDIVNTMHFGSVEPVNSITGLALAGHVAASFFDALAQTGVDGSTESRYLETMLSGSISRVNLPTIKVYDRDAVGSPLAVATAAGVKTKDAAGKDLPNEVALCASYRGDNLSLAESAADDADADSRPERPRSRFRGRMFIGPWNTIGGEQRPTTAARAACIALIKELADLPSSGELFEAGVVFGIYSAESNAFAEVVHAWCDDAWDTQRRRGLAPSTRQQSAVTTP